MMSGIQILTAAPRGLFLSNTETGYQSESALRQIKRRFNLRRTVAKRSIACSMIRGDEQTPYKQAQSEHAG